MKTVLALLLAAVAALAQSEAALSGVLPPRVSQVSLKLVY